MAGMSKLKRQLMALNAPKNTNKATMVASKASKAQGSVAPGTNSTGGKKIGVMKPKGATMYKAPKTGGDASPISVPSPKASKSSNHVKGGGAVKFHDKKVKAASDGKTGGGSVRNFAPQPTGKKAPLGKGSHQYKNMPGI